MVAQTALEWHCLTPSEREKDLSPHCLDFIGELPSSGSCSNLHDIVITDYCNKDESYDVVIHAGENVVWSVDRKMTTDVVIESGGQLTISCHLGMPSDGKIKVQRGARLIVDGGTITHNKTMWEKCSEGQWGGILVYGNKDVEQQPEMQNESYAIQPDDPGILLLKNGATLEYARTAISTNSEGIPWPELQNYWGGFVYATDSYFINNHRSAEFMKYDHPNFSAFIKCSFINQDGTANYGITNWGTNGITIYGSLFTDINTVGLLAYDASMDVFKSKFTNIHHAIEGFSTMPLFHDLSIGSQEPSLGNTFEDNYVGLYTVGIHTLFVGHNVFTNNTFGVSVNGGSFYDIWNNNFSGSSAGIELVQTLGLKSNKLRCNEYNNDYIGIEIFGDNSEMLFNGEKFSTAGIPTYDVFLTNEGATPGIVADQGLSSVPFWNYFTASQNDHQINTTGNTVKFNYFHPDPAIDVRLKPKCDLSGGFSCTTPNNFENHQATFSNPSMEIDCGTVPTPETPTKDLLIDVRQQLLDIEGQGLLSEEDRVSYEQLMQQEKDVYWSLAERYYQQNNFDALGTLLLEENTKEANKRLIALMIDLNQYDEASDMVDAFPIELIDDAHFQFIERLNIRRLQQNEPLSEADEATLDAIVADKLPSSALAKSLLSMMKGRVFEPELPEIVQGLAMPETGAMEDRDSGILKEYNIDAKDLIIYPSPAQNVVNFNIPSAFIGGTMKIFNSMGVFMLEKNISKHKLQIIDEEIGGEGVFWVILQQGKNGTIAKKFILLK